MGSAGWLSTSICQLVPAGGAEPVRHSNVGRRVRAFAHSCILSVSAATRRAWGATWQFEMPLLWREAALLGGCQPVQPVKSGLGGRV